MNNPTDTNQASELFELCKEVYEKTKWVLGNSADIYDYPYQQDKIGRWLSPIYTSDYLLEKLPSNIYLIKFTGDKVDGAYRAVRESEPFHPKNTMTAHAGTPLKALLKLTIALSEAGELK